MIEYVFGLFRNVYDLNMKFRQAQVSGDFSDITEEERETMLREMGRVASIWKILFTMCASQLSTPLLIINKYVFCQLTARKFVWLHTYTADLLITLTFIYAFGWHLLWLQEENSGLGLEENPSPDMMYVDAYGYHMMTFEINIQFYVGLWLLISFIR